MITVINEYTGMSAEKPRKEIICTEVQELSNMVVGHGSIAYVISAGKIVVYDEQTNAWAGTDGNMLSEGGSETPAS